MEDPKEIMTTYGYHKYIQAVVNLKESIFYFTNNADDLELDDELDALYQLEKVIDNSLGKFLPK